MDLIAELKKSVKNPLSFVNLFIIFVNTFLFLIIGLTLLSVVTFFYLRAGNTTACNQVKTIQLNGNVSSTREVAYSVDYSGNDRCFLNAWVTWANPNDSLDLWVYNPKGNVNIIQSSKDQTNNFYYNTSPLETGTWRIVIKTTEKQSINYSGEVSFH